ncbi:hypothetical protein [Parvibaculum sp.]|jgi:hypothetical protein|uniref:hypothetical protein n=1 Tax=Parvibaculum sp. TaxID=2024848 RepID=UPI003919792C
MMSICSEAAKRLTLKSLDEMSGIVNLLAAVSAEVATIAREIAFLGDRLVVEAAAEAVRPQPDMQMIDLIGQNAEAQARLLDEIVNSLRSSGDAGFEPLRRVISSVPFHGARRRLSAALEGETIEPLAELSDAGEQETDWF